MVCSWTSRGILSIPYTFPPPAFFSEQPCQEFWVLAKNELLAHFQQLCFVVKGKIVAKVIVPELQHWKKEIARCGETEFCGWLPVPFACLNTEAFPWEPPSWYWSQQPACFKESWWGKRGEVPCKWNSRILSYCRTYACLTKFTETSGSSFFYIYIHCFFPLNSVKGKNSLFLHCLCGEGSPPFGICIS